MKKIALIDAYGFVFRAYHSLPPLKRVDGTPVGAVYGFTNMLIKLLAGLNVSHVAVVFDSGSKTFRNDIYPLYKANRPPCPEDLKPQFAIVRQASQALNLVSIEKQGFEADDIIATLAKKSAQDGFEVLIVSSDKDLMQLIDDNISMYDAMKNKIIKAHEVREKFFVDPKQVLDVLSLMGDSSDNVPGVKGIGPKTASQLILQFENLENIFNHLDEIKQLTKRQLLIDNHDNALLSKKLITLDENVELSITLDDLQLKAINPHNLISFLEEQGFRSLISKIKKEFKIEEYQLAIDPKGIEELNNNTKKTNNYDVKYSEITNISELDKLYHNAIKNGVITINYFLFADEIDLITLSTDEINQNASEVFYIKIANKNYYDDSNKALDLFNFNEQKSDNQQENLFDISIIFKILEDSSIRKIFFVAKDFFKFLYRYNTKNDRKINIQNIIFDDVSLINYLLNSSTHNNLRELIDCNLDTNLEELNYGEIFNDLAKNKLPEIFQDSQSKINFFCFINHKIFQLYKIFSTQLFSLKLNNVYLQYQLPLIKVLAQMEFFGIKIDREKLQNLSEEFSIKISLLTKQIFSLANQEFNIASSQQLADILFNKLGLTSKKKSKKTGAPSTAFKVLEELALDGIEIVDKIIEYRKFFKLKNTYTDGLPKEINKNTLRIHTHFSNIATLTGRLSSSNPNLQNLPIKSAEGKKIRQCFIAEKNFKLLSVDYSQIELRIIAHIAKINPLIEAFKCDKDIHAITASQIFNIELDKVDDQMRSKAKAINFGIVYGISAYGLAKQLKISNIEADNYIKSYFVTYPGIEEYMKKTTQFALDNGYVETIIGRKIFISDIQNKNKMIFNEAKRQAINAPIQGSSADIIFKAMIDIDREFIKHQLTSKMILQIHDELVFEINDQERDLAIKIIKDKMENSIKLDAELKIDISDII
jgi:DNA polymerase-1